MLSRFKTLICSVTLTSKESITGKKMNLHYFALGKYAANLWQMRSKSGANMVNATFASLSYLQPMFFGIQMWHLPPLPNISHFCDIFARSKFVQKNFFVPWKNHTQVSEINSFARVLTLSLSAWSFLFSSSRRDIFRSLFLFSSSTVSWCSRWLWPKKLLFQDGEWREKLSYVISVTRIADLT